MSKRSNILLLKLGYNLFWDQKKWSQKFSRFYISLNYFLNQELAKIKYFCFNIRIIYSSFIHLNIYRNNKYFYKLNIIKNIQSKVLRKNKILNKKQNIIRKIKIFKLNVINKNYFGIRELINYKNKFLNYYNINNHIIYQNLFVKNFIQYRNLHYFAFMLKFIILNVTKYQSIVYFNYFLKYNFILFFKFKDLQQNHKKFLDFNKKNKLYVLKFLNLRLIENYLELLLKRLYKKKYMILMNNILNPLLSNYFIINKFNYKRIITKKFKIYFFLYIFFFAKNIELIARYISFYLIKTKKHIKNAITLLRLIRYMWMKKLIKFKGLKLYIAGKLNGKMKKSKYSYQLDRYGSKTFKNKTLNFYFLPLYTRFGVFSIKLWLVY